MIARLLIVMLAAGLLGVACQEISPPPLEPPPEPLPQACKADRVASPVTRAVSTKAIRSRLESLSTRAAGQTRIVGGQEALPDAWPWTAAIGIRFQDSIFQYCGGSLIASDWVLTAAHCEVRVGDVVILGRHDLGSNAGEEILVKYTLTHSAYNADTNDNDIALVKLVGASDQETIALGDVVVQSGSLSTVVGWGALAEGGQTVSTLQQVVVPIISNDVCNASYGGSITNNMICAGLVSGGIDSCQGDSGGPLMVQAGQDWLQAGIVSFGVGCARPNFYGVYTRVSRYGGWASTCMNNPPE